MKQHIEQLQKLIIKENLDAYFITTLDQHLSEYSSDYDKVLTYISSFTGSTASLLVTTTESYLWVDGRYHIQADNQCLLHGITIQKMGVEGTPTIKDFIKNNNINKLGLDATTIDANSALSFNEVCSITSIDLIKDVWTTRGERPLDKAFFYDVQYCGLDRVEKIKKLQSLMEDCNYHIISTLDDIAWLFNIRGRAIACNPFVRSFAIISKSDATLYITENTFTDDEINSLKNDNIIIQPYLNVYSELKKLSGPVLYDLRKINYELYTSLNEKYEHVNKPNPTQKLKSIKNDVELNNTIQAHIKDGVAVTNFMYQLKHMKKASSEIILMDDLYNYRKEQELFYDISFNTICGYQQNGALMHYFATPENHSNVELEGLLLVDSGGQYLDGTTDITRTFAMGPITNEQKIDFTMVLKGVLRLQNAKFLAGTTGEQLEFLAREMIFQHGLNYRCGTGHGVGHFGGVHEGPHGLSPRANMAIEPGTITTNEPGIYHEGKYGIRLENEMICREDFSNEYGSFYSFETITMCPFDLDAVDYSLLMQNELEQLNNYHNEVYNKLAPHLKPEVKTWLKDFINK